MVLTAAIEIADLSFRRAAGRELVLDSISLTAHAGELLVLLGPNGAGKSTLVHCLLGLTTPEQGHVRALGDELRGLGRREIAKRIAYVPQAGHSAFAFTVQQIVLMGRTTHIDGVGSPSAQDHEIARRAMIDMGVDHLRKKPFTQISGGEQQLALIARAVAQDTPIIVMDEPTSSLDLGNQGRVLKLMKNLAAAGKTVVMTTHLPDQAFNLRARVALLRSGRLVAVGAAAEVCDRDSVSRLYGAPMLTLVAEDAKGVVAFAPDLD
ncbi:ABC transporter ATP-binding protein [Methylosinus sp. H3A]|uniref:ABC transporter ATP-binding protein n=1 Tax=Methylosinus sp. H3A TaxID=2785786 RepID=UPI0018C34201|nr:ABC transporter ATP-binding protein [Methylosinus sp. H3A]MBG0808391.1 ABC transporter ATP-binding protein [Methylosinus sp. H3A]